MFYFKEPVKDFPSALEKEFPLQWSPDRFHLKVRVPESRLKELVIPILNQFSISDFYTEKIGVEEVMDEILSQV